LLNFAFVVSVLLFIGDDLFQALVPHLFIVVEHLLQLIVQVLALKVPPFFFRLDHFLQLVLLSLSESLVSLKLILLGCQDGLGSHRSSQPLLSFIKVFLKTIELGLLITHQLLQVLHLVRGGVISCHSFVSLPLKFHDQSLTLLQLISQGLDVSSTLAL
jgi:hypothetical protein